MNKQSPDSSSSGPDEVSMVLTDQLCFALYSATHEIQRLYRPLLDDLGLTYSQYLILLVLWEDGELSVGAIGERLFLSSATLTPTLKRMERAGLIARRRSQIDERRVTVELTASGRDLESDVRAVTQAVTCAADGAVDARSLLTQLVQLRENLVQQAEGNTPSTT